MTVGIQDIFLAAERADQHQQRRFRQVKVGKKRLDDSKVESGMNEEIGFTRSCTDVAGILLPNEFKSADRRCADGDDAAGLAACSLNFFRCNSEMTYGSEWSE